MKKTILFCFIITGFFISSCSKDETQMEESKIQPAETVTSGKKGVLQFGSAEEFSEVVTALKERKALDIKLLPATRAAAQAQVGEFVSLRQHLVEQGLQEFTDAELAEITADSLEYEPEDSLIVDPYMTAVLNGEREVQVGDKICRFVDEGMIMYDANEKVLFEPALVEHKVPAESLIHGQSMEVEDMRGTKAQFVKIDYIKPVEHILVDGNIGGGSGGGSSSGGNNNSGGGTVTYNYDGSITLTNGVRIPQDRVRRATYKKGGGNGSWLAKGVSGLFGLNVTITNNFNKRHRMKLRMYEQDYIIYRAVGMYWMRA